MKYLTSFEDFSKGEDSKEKLDFVIIDYGGDVGSYEKFLKIMGGEKIKFDSNTRTPRVSRQCNCPSRDLFNFGCRCGGC